MNLDYWFLFPASVAIATIAMASGIGGAVFFSPLFILVLKLEPAVAVGTALATELFGFTSGVLAYLRRGLIDFRLGRTLLAFSLPAAMVGALNAHRLPGDLLKGVFAVGVMFIGYQMYHSFRRERRASRPGEPAEAAAGPESTLVDRNGVAHRYTVCHRGQAKALALIGGGFLGIISVGLAELQEWHLVVRCRVPAAVAVATSIFVVVVTVLTASAGHFYHFATGADPTVLQQVGSVVVFTIPGVIVGGQVGPFIQARVNPEYVKVGLAVLFALVGIFMLTTL